VVARLIDRRALDALIRALAGSGYSVLGPRARNGSIVYDAIESEHDLARGVIDEQRPGSYRLVPDPEGRSYAYTLGAATWKSTLFPPHQRLWSGERSGSVFTVVPEPRDERRYAFIGVRACELAAIAIQDRVFMEGPYVDQGYAARRSSLFVLAFNCIRSAAHCFCASMYTGPHAGGPLDLALTEIGADTFVVTQGSAAGAQLLDEIAAPAATAEQIGNAERAVDAAAAQQTRALPDGAAATLKANLDHPRYAAVAERCVSCANCTAVCPTCFCSTVDDLVDLDGAKIKRERRTDSCFSIDFSYIHGGSVRQSTASRYRQWLTHKLSTWQDQFGTSGCTGCGRCTTWCPAGIDIVEEVRAIRAGTFQGVETV
jgi:sulfhydrogenase subunit beta (sulfur reductase)